MGHPVLSIQDLTVGYPKAGRIEAAVHEISLSIERGETVGLVGESGSGKSTIAYAVMGCLPPEASITAGKIFIDENEVVQSDPRRMRAIWGKRAMLVPQEPSSALNPSMRAGDQVAEALRMRYALARREARERTLDLFRSVHLADPVRVFESYPHQLSGGMRQRVVIAIALSVDPDFLVLDEPTTSLDVTTQAAFLDVVEELVRKRSIAVLYITHDLGVVTRVSDRIAVLYAGELVEMARTADLLDLPLHPYSAGLFESLPRLNRRAEAPLLRAIPGSIPELGSRPAGCLFAPRCPLVIDLCANRPPLISAAERRVTRCHRWTELLGGASDLFATETRRDSGKSRVGQPHGRLLIEGLAVHYRRAHSAGKFLSGGAAPSVRALDGIKLEAPGGTFLGLVGESGSGKTTAARAITGLVAPSAGSTALDGTPLPTTIGSRNRRLLRRIQMVFQNPEEAFNPHLRIGEAVARPLVRLSGFSARAARERVKGLLERVGLPPSYADRLPGTLSGGEKQRAAIARAMAVEPDLLICDEAVSSLDVSTRASVMNLLSELQAAWGGSILFISHDLSLVATAADLVAVIYRGRLMEFGPSSSLFDPPYHPYTEALLSAIPSVEGTRVWPIRLPSEGLVRQEESHGCPFASRCPRFLGKECLLVSPPEQELPNGKRFFCHIPAGQLARDQTGPPAPANLRHSERGL